MRALEAGIRAGMHKAARQLREPNTEDKAALMGFLRRKKGKVTDEQFHAYAESLGVDHSKAEEFVYGELAKKAEDKKMVVKLSYPVFRRMWLDLEHAADCGHPECDRCEKIARSIEDGPRAYNHSLELLGMLPKRD